MCVLAVYVFGRAALTQIQYVCAGNTYATSIKAIEAVHQQGRVSTKLHSYLCHLPRRVCDAVWMPGQSIASFCLQKAAVVAEPRVHSLPHTLYVARVPRVGARYCTHCRRVLWTFPSTAQHNSWRLARRGRTALEWLLHCVSTSAHQLSMPCASDSGIATPQL